MLDRQSVQPPVIRNLENAEHYRWGDGCDGWRLLAGDDLAVIRERMPPGTREVPHHHRRARQLFYVLAGRLRVAIESTVFDLAAGDALEVPPRRRHQVHNVTDADAVFLVISSPSTSGDRVESSET